MNRLILATLGVAALYQASPCCITHHEYIRVARAANNLRPAAYRAPPWWRTVGREMLHIVEHEALAAYEALDLNKLDLRGAETAAAGAAAGGGSHASRGGGETVSV